MSEIKTRENVKGIKALDKSVDLGQRMKNSLVKTKDRVQSMAEDHHGSAEEYASDKVEELEGEAVSRTTDGVQNTVQRGKDAYKRHREAKRQETPDYQRPMREQTKEQARNRQTSHAQRQTQTSTTSPNPNKTSPTQTNPAKPNAPNKAIKQRATSQTVKQTAKSTGRQAAKNGQRTIKTAEQSSKVAIKTAKQSEKAAKKAAEAAAKASAKAAKASAKAAKSAGSAVAKTASATLKAIIAGFAKLIAAIAAGGWVVLIIILIIAMVAMIAASCFGLFAGGDEEQSLLRDAIQTINADYDRQITEIKDSHIYEELEMTGTRANWKDVLAIYSIVVTTDEDDPQEIVTMTDEKEALLASYFWEMNVISYSERIDTVTVLVEVEDGAGGTNEVEEEQQVTILSIVVTHKTAWQMADQLNFTAEQREMLEQLLSPENNSMWMALLYGIHVGDSDIVAVALSQIGNVGGEPYWSWYGFESRVAWCHCFVSWCADQCGYLEAGIIPNTAGCCAGVDWFKAKGQWVDGSVEPVPGMIIYFDWDNKGDSGPQDGFSDHVGIVEKVENGYVYTVEGNTGDSCAERQYTIGHYEILGYGVPEYN